MIAEQILGALLKANLAASAAIVLTLTLRPIVGRIVGARSVYRLWLVVPVTALAISIPAPHYENRPVAAATVLVAEHPPASEEGSLAGTLTSATHSVVESAATWAATTRSELRLSGYSATLVLTLWAAGALLLFGRAVIRSRNTAVDPLFGPALVGVLRPKLVLPSDFTTRFNAREQTMVLAHEGVHSKSGHPLMNGLVELARCANWVNPLAHVAAFYLRADQELSCDAAVIAQFPGERHIYAQALLKTQIASMTAPLVCGWPGRSSSLLRERIQMLTRRLPGRSRSAAGTFVVAALIAGTGYSAWAAQPTDKSASAGAVAQRPPAAVPAVPPAGLLTELEKKRHALFIGQAAAGNIDVIFIGDSEVDFWRYDNSGNPEWNNHSGGKAEWDRRYVPLRAVNFGVEGAHTRSVLWRLQNGELDGIRPKVVVFIPLGIADAANHGIRVPQIIEGNKAIIAEIRKLQPQARILLVALPRGQPSNLTRQVMKPVDGELAKLADNRMIYYVDLNGRFLAHDGTPTAALYADIGAQVLSPQGYTAWAQAMNPMLEKLIAR